MLSSGYLGQEMGNGLQNAIRLAGRRRRMLGSYIVVVPEWGG